jgi:hypothetical protein
MTTYASTMREIAWVKKETAFGEVPVFAAGDGVDATLVLTPDQEWKPVNSKKAGGSLEEEIQGVRTGTWTYSGRMRTTAAGTAPDCGPILDVGFGLETIVGATSVTYSIVVAGAPGTIALGRQVGDTLWEFASGAWVEQIVLEFGADNMITASGGFKYYGHVLGAPTAEAAIATATEIVLQAGDAGKVSEGAIIKGGTEDNGGVGYTVSGVSDDGLTLTITPALAGPINAADAVLPIIPAHTTAGNSVAGIANGFKVDTVAVGMITGKVTYDTGHKPLDQETQSDMAIGVFKDDRNIVVESDAYFVDANASHVARAWSGALHALELRAGPTTDNKKWTASLPAVRFGVVAPTSGDGDVAHASLGGPARKSVTAGDEFALALS